MPHYMRAITSADRENRTYNVVVLWDDDDLNAIVCQCDAGSMPTGHQYDPDKWYITDAEIDSALSTMGFRVVGSGNMPRGERMVIRANSDRTFFDPVTRNWYSSNPHRESV